jgi:uncharacterized protein involved in exopolysaccharide biosynthesis
LDLEGEIGALEEDLRTIARRLEDPPPDVAQVQKLAHEYERVQQVLDQLMEEWGALSEELV